MPSIFSFHRSFLPHPSDGSMAEAEPQQSTYHPFPISAAVDNLPFDFRQASYLEITEQPLFNNVLSFVSNLFGSNTRSTNVVMKVEDDDPGLDCDYYGEGDKKEIPHAEIGLGWHTFDFFFNSSLIKMAALKQRIGQPVGTSCCAEFFSSLVLFADVLDQSPLLKLCEEATQAATAQKENRVSIWRFDTRDGSNYWERVSCRATRSIDTIVLEEATKKPLLDDLHWFVKNETKSFYAQHGIPYHRCYLFHGEPGMGKSSMIYTLAGHLKRNLCFLQMNHETSDETLRAAMQRLPSRAVVVLEDVDALFTNERKADGSVSKSALSFSGFLNSLDGAGAPQDVIIFMTSNHPERLDPAVMRHGRIDVKVPFKVPVKEVVEQYFLSFYPGANAAAAAFATIVGGRFAERKLSMAQLQHFFLACHRLQLGPESATEHVKDFVFDDFPQHYHQITTSPSPTVETIG
jgi:chaperone BCS1